MRQHSPFRDNCSLAAVDVTILLQGNIPTQKNIPIQMSTLNGDVLVISLV